MSLPHQPSALNMLINQNSKEVSDRKLNVGPWDESQSLKYLIFLDQNKIVMASKQKIKKLRVFDQMSDFVQSRNSLQCRSHYQKAIEKYKDVKSIISHEKQKAARIDYKDRLKQLKQGARVKLDYQNSQIERMIVSNHSQNEQKKNESPMQFPLFSSHLMPNFFSLIPPQMYTMMPMSPNQILPNNFMFSNFPNN